MKVYIQDTQTSRYFKNPFVWVDDESAAYNFVTSLEAFDFCLQMNHGRGVRILLSFDDPRHDVCLFSFDSAPSNQTLAEGMAPEISVAAPEQEPELVGVG